MKKMDRTHHNYFLIVAELILAILCITGIVQYFELLYRDGRRTELDDRIISEMADREKAAALAEMSPLLEHLRMKAEGKKYLQLLNVIFLRLI